MGASDSGFLGRLRGRWRNGLLMQELLDRLLVVGLAVQPYVVTRELTADLPAIAAPEGFTLRELTALDSDAIIAINVHRRDRDELREQFARRRCFGAFQRDRLVGHTWVDFNEVVALRTDTLFTLNPDESYFTDMYVAPAFRGARLAPWLRAEVMRRLDAEGRHQSYSLSLTFNRSTRRFKQRLGAREIEWRLRLQFLPRRLPGIDVRLRRVDPSLRTPALLVVGPGRR